MPLDPLSLLMPDAESGLDVSGDNIMSALGGIYQQQALKNAASHISASAIGAGSKGSYGAAIPAILAGVGAGEEAYQSLARQQRQDALKLAQLQAQAQMRQQLTDYRYSQLALGQRKADEMSAYHTGMLNKKSTASQPKPFKSIRPDDSVVLINPDGTVIETGEKARKTKGAGSGGKQSLIPDWYYDPESKQFRQRLVPKTLGAELGAKPTTLAQNIVPVINSLLPLISEVKRDAKLLASAPDKTDILAAANAYNFPRTSELISNIPVLGKMTSVTGYKAASDVDPGVNRFFTKLGLIKRDIQQRLPGGSHARQVLDDLSTHLADIGQNPIIVEEKLDELSRALTTDLNMFTGQAKLGTPPPSDAPQQGKMTFKDPSGQVWGGQIVDDDETSASDGSDEQDIQAVGNGEETEE